MDTNTPNNDLLARYLQAIGEHLPAATRDDVLAELRANLQAQLDDRAEELNRSLIDADIAPILQQHGRPIVVATRYLPQQYLIGPAIFPYYLMVLRKATPFVLLAIFIAHASSLLFVHTLPDLIRGIALSLGQLIPDFILFVFWLTAAFAIAEYVFARRQTNPFGLSWDPTKLPAIKPTFKGKSRASRIADLVFHCLWILYVLAIPGHLFLILGPGEIALRAFPVAFAPAWHTFYILLLVILGFQLLTKILALNASYDRYQQVLDLVTKLLGVATTAFLATVKTYFIATGPTANLAVLANVNQSVGIAFRIVLIIVVVQLLIGAWKLFRPSLGASRLAI